MKLLKWLLITVVALVLIIGVGVAALVYLVDWNDYKETIQNQTKKHTGRDLVIAGELNPSVFPWAGISIGELTLANAEGFGDQPFARIDSADVKVEVLPLLRRVVNIRTVELNGLALDLQKAADGTTNWDDLAARETTTTTTTDDNTTTEVEGNSATIAALAVGGISVKDANVSWTDAQGGLDARLTGFNLSTGAIELAKPFALSTDFSVVSNSLDLAADIKGKGEVTIDLDQQRYSLSNFSLDTNAKGGTLPGGALSAALGATIVAALGDNRIDISELSLDALGIKLTGDVDVTGLDAEPQIAGSLASNDFVPRELFTQLGMEAPVTADPAVLGKASLSLALAASPAAAALNDLTITLDDTTFSGQASLPSLAVAMPPVRYDFEVDAIDLDRYLPPPAEGEDGEPPATDEDAGADAPAGDAGAGDDIPIELPTELLRQLDVDGEFRVGSVKVSNLTTQNIRVPVTAKDGRLAIDGLAAALYDGKIDSTVTLDATGDTPVYGVDFSLAGIQAEPLLGDLLQDDAFLSGQGDFSSSLRTRGNSVNALKAGLDGSFNTAFTDGSINGINIGYQLRRVQAALKGQEAPPPDAVKTDFSSLSVSGTFNDGVMTSNDLDMRSPLLRLGGAGTVDLPQEAIDYVATVLITGTTEGQGGKDLAALKGVKLDVPIVGTFAALAADPAGVIFDGLKANISGNLKAQAEARAKAEADKLKAEAEEKLKAKEAEAKAALKAKEEEARARLEEKLGEQLGDDLKGKLKGLLK